MKAKSARSAPRSECPINAAVEVIGDQWSLLILRDMLLKLQSRFSEFHRSEESVATNILSARLNHLAAHGLIEKLPDPNDGRAALYLPTEKAIDLIPVLLAAMAWSDAHAPQANRYPGLMKSLQTDPHGAAQQLADRVRQFRKEVCA